MNTELLAPPQNAVKPSLDETTPALRLWSTPHLQRLSGESASIITSKIYNVSEISAEVGPS
jgi:hypothetical protein